MRHGESLGAKVDLEHDERLGAADRCPGRSGAPCGTPLRSADSRQRGACPVCHAGLERRSTAPARSVRQDGSERAYRAHIETRGPVPFAPKATSIDVRNRTQEEEAEVPKPVTMDLSEACAHRMAARVRAGEDVGEAAVAEGLNGLVLTTTRAYARGAGAVSEERRVAARAWLKIVDVAIRERVARKPRKSAEPAPAVEVVHPPEPAPSAPPASVDEPTPSPAPSSPSPAKSGIWVPGLESEEPPARIPPPSRARVAAALADAVLDARAWRELAGVLEVASALEPYGADCARRLMAVARARAEAAA